MYCFILINIGYALSKLDRAKTNSIRWHPIQAIRFKKQTKKPQRKPSDAQPDRNS